MASAATTEFRDASKKFHSSTSRDVRTSEGIFFTPKKVRDLLFQRLGEIGVNRPKKVLEPSFGSGEFVYDALQRYPGAEIIGVEKNRELYESVSNIPNMTCCDFMDWKGNADLIIGNPPYFVIKPEKSRKKAMAACLTGRPNIYILFLYKCIAEHLDTDGHIAFVIPTSLFNCSYYQPMRDYIAANTTICHIEVLNKPGFYQTTQETMLIIIQKRVGHDNYLFRTGGMTYISPHYKALRELIRGTTTIEMVGLGVKTGCIVWNQNRDKLTEDNTATLLVYTKNIVKTESGYELRKDVMTGEKKQYIRGTDKQVLSGPLILVDRGYGNVFDLRACLVDEPRFYAENHINVIYPKTAGAMCELGRVIKSFMDPRSRQFIEWFVGNGTLSASNLLSVMPVFG